MRKALKKFLSIMFTLTMITFNLPLTNVFASSDLPSKLLVGYWHNFDNGTGIVKLSNVSSDWDVINVAFAETSGDRSTLQFSPVTGSDDDFKSDIKALNSKGKKVVLSIGGQNGVLLLPDQTSKQNFINSAISLIDKYGFNGIDIDLESGMSLNGGDTDFKNPTTPQIVNLISALKTICNHYGSNFILSMAPETAYVQGGYTAYANIWGAYLPVIYGLKDNLTYIHVQHYNAGGSTALDGKTYNQGTPDYEVAMAEMLLHGFPIAGNPNNVFPALRQDQVMIGLPACPAAAPSGGYIKPTDMEKALNYLINGTSFGGAYKLANSNGYSNFRGLMSWSINWDINNNYEFSKAYRNYFNNPSTTPSNPDPTDPSNGNGGGTSNPSDPGNGSGNPTSGIFPWAANTSYKVNDLVSYNNVIYKCLQAHTSLVGWEPANTPALWSVDADLNVTSLSANNNTNTFLEFKSENAYSAVDVLSWAPNTAYKIGDLVSYNNVVYKCIQAHTSLVGWEPPNTPALWSADTTTTPGNGSGGTDPSNGGGSTGVPASPAQSNFPGKFFAPYVDATAWPTFSLTDCFNKTGQKYFTLAFITSDANGNPAWGGYSSLGMDSNTYIDDINSLRSKGGDVIVSFGGANGTELASASGNSDYKTLQAKYQKVIDKYKLTRIDFDIEGSAITNKTTIDTRNKAIAALEASNPKLTVSYTLPVLPSGLTSDGEYVLSNASANKVRIDLVNVMAMDYGDGAAPSPNGKMGTYAIQSAQSTHNQCVSLGIQTKIGVTPMIGQNDTSSEIFYQSDAQTLLNWANTSDYTSFLSMWADTRDYVNGTGNYNFSGVNKSDFEFTNIFKSFTK